MDPYPFILLNLFLSMLAAIQAPVIMMSRIGRHERQAPRELDSTSTSERIRHSRSRAQAEPVSDQIGDIDEAADRASAAPPRIRTLSFERSGVSSATVRSRSLTQPREELAPRGNPRSQK